MSIDHNATRKLNELAEALELQDEDLLLVVRYPYTLDTSFKLPFGTLRAAIASLIGGGDVSGPSSATSGNVPVFDGPSGRNISDGGIDIPGLLSRNNHTGQQPFSTISDLPTTLAGYGITDASPFVSVEEEGIEITGALLSLNFVGAGVTAVDAGGHVTITISGAGDMVLAAVQVVTGQKTFALNTFRLRDTSATFFTTINTLATSDQTVQIPATAATDNFVLQNLTQTLVGKTLTSPVINTGILNDPQIDFGLDAPGDLIIRDLSDVTTRLALGAEFTVLSSIAGLPAWAPLSYRLLGYRTGLDLNAAAPIDLSTVTINGSKYIPLLIVIYNNSAAAAAATLGLYTAAAGGGTAVVTPVLLADLSAANRMQILAVTDLGDAPLTAATLYPRLTVAAGGAATADIAIYGVQLPS
jgi:hypothetical protein